MKLSTLFVIYAVVAVVFGIGFLLFPSQVFSLYGVSGNAPLNFTAQLFGAALIELGVLTWSVREVDNLEALRAIVLALFIGEGIGFIVALIGQINGVTNSLGWSTVVVYLLFTLGFGYFQFLNRPS